MSYDRIWVDDPRPGYSSIYVEEAAPNKGAVPYYSSSAVEKAVREDREAVVRRMRERSVWFREMGKSPAGLHSDDRLADEYADEADFFERGEHRK